MRLIDADALKGYLQLALMVSDKLAKEQPDIGELVNTFMNGMITQIDAMPTIDGAPEWIPCSERLPEEYGDYLVTMESTGWNLETYRTIDIAYFGTGWHKADMVLAWMPMPKAYEGERQ